MADRCRCPGSLGTQLQAVVAQSNLPTFPRLTHKPGQVKPTGTRRKRKHNNHTYKLAIRTTHNIQYSRCTPSHYTYMQHATRANNKHIWEPIQKVFLNSVSRFDLSEERIGWSLYLTRRGEKVLGEKEKRRGSCVEKRELKSGCVLDFSGWATNRMTKTASDLYLDGKVLNIWFNVLSYSFAMVIMVILRKPIELHVFCLIAVFLVCRGQLQAYAALTFGCASARHWRQSGTATVSRCHVFVPSSQNFQRARL